MLIVVDYDETYTRAPDVWDQLIDALLERDAIVVCCTYNAKVTPDMIHGLEVIHAEEGITDKAMAMEAAGFCPENAIWIDNQPDAIFTMRLR